MAKRKPKPKIYWDADVEFEIPTITVKARTAGEAKRAVIERLKNIPASRFVCKPKMSINENWRRNREG